MSRRHQERPEYEFAWFQVHADPANMGPHMRLVSEHIQEAMELLDPSSMSIRIFGTPTDDVLAQMREMAGSGVSVTVSTLSVGFDRFSSG